MLVITDQEACYTGMEMPKLVLFRNLGRWFWRYRNTALVCLLLLFALLRIADWYLHTQSARLAQSLDTGRQPLLATIDSLEHLPTPSQIQPGQRNGTAAYQTLQLQKVSNDIKPDLALPPQWLVNLNRQHLPHDTSTSMAYQDSGVAMARSDSLIRYQAAVMAALQKLLEYNAADDMQHFKAGSGDTIERLQRAKTGLNDTVIHLQEAPAYNDPGLNDLLGYISTMSIARDQLVKDGDVTAWVKTCGAVQTAILMNRQAFWQTNEAAVLQQLQIANNELAHIEASLR